VRRKIYHGERVKNCLVKITPAVFLLAFLEGMFMRTLKFKLCRQNPVLSHTSQQLLALPHHP
jgi:hypothetical protein